MLQPLYGFSGKDPARFARAAGHQDLLYLHDPELTFEQVTLLTSQHRHQQHVAAHVSVINAVHSNIHCIRNAAMV